MRKIIFSILLITTTTFITTIGGLRIEIDEHDDLPLTISLQGRDFFIKTSSEEINLDGAPIVIGDLARLTLCINGLTYKPRKWWPYYDTK